MAAKNETPTTKDKTETKTAPEKVVPVPEGEKPVIVEETPVAAPIEEDTAKLADTDSPTDPEKSTEQENSSKPASNSKSSTARTDGLSPEMMELVTELRDTVKRINPKNHTAKTLRRALSNVSDILKDIDKLYPES
jgi:hypothetical protein